MMTNFEHYKETIKKLNGDIAVNKQGEMVPCLRVFGSLKCEECIFSNGSIAIPCRPNLVRWLTEEYEEPSIDWSKVPVDTPVYVKMAEICDWVPRHFAKYERGTVYTWLDGATSFTTEKKTDFTPWAYAKLAKEEDKNE